MPAIAIIGASANREKFSNKCVRLYKSLGWVVFPVNPKDSEIEGLKCYNSISEIPSQADRVSIYLPPHVTISIIPELLQAGVKSVILNPGAESDELVKGLRDNGINPKLACSIRMEGRSPEDIR
ncbi:MAG: CoA-binding protein [Candidatus Diapherotrites archaeon]|uniref:CoA-binding protein n=1 Tax=Candidatus Iainarchaeum sp. TaxID=3101447 RepID=A0A8T3YN23_9ARCH|nr:CoA-binding protein [Candidatus Diapherotrites archaeon]